MPLPAQSDRLAAVAEYIGRFWRLIIIPLLWLLAWTLSGHFALAWLVALGIYILLISLMAILDLPNEESRSQLLLWTPKLFRITGTIVWGGFLALLYWLTYLLIFHFKELNAR